MTDQFATVDDYIGSFPEATRVVLEEVRRAIRLAVPGVAETIKYQMPTMTIDGSSLVHFAAWKQHIGLYPLPSGDGAFEQAIAPYRTAKGTGKFPLDQPVPYDLIGQVAELLAGRHRDSHT